ncbi:hypothetical protein [Streptomyces rochei]|uniref:hypothetical protein n=1 Tax=Streptomyces rochei TaxID=1928 RepID=UPI00363A6D01
MSNETPPASEDEPPGVDEVLAAALEAQGVAGVRALGLLRDAHRVLTGAGFVRPAEVAAACVRSAADALLGLPGAPVTAGLKPAAKDLLAAVDAFPPPAAAEAARAGTPDVTDSGAPDGPSAPERAAWERVTVAAEVLRAELERPGGYHRARARGIIERLMKVELGAAQETALDVWGTIYGVASGILHGSAATPGEAASLYTELLGAARNLLVPLPARAARVLALAAIEHPGEKEARELAGWADPRAEAYFFRSGPAAAWLETLHEYAPHLLLADEAAGAWPAAPFLEHVAAVAPQAARKWLADHAVQLAAAGPYVLGALLCLADAGALAPADIRLLLPHVTVRPPVGMPAEEASLSRRMVASWAGNLPMPARDGDWLVVVEALLKDTVDIGHAGFLAFEAARQHAHAAQDPAITASREALPDLMEVLQREWAARLPEHDITGLLRELVVTVHSAAGGPFRWARAVRGALAGLLRDDIEAPVRRPWHAYVDLDEVRVLDARFFLGPVLCLGPLLARAVLDLAAADAAAGLPLTERMRAWPRFAAADAHLHDRVLAAHLAAHPPTEGADAEGTGPWWDLAVEVTMRLLAGRPTPEGARLAALVLQECPSERSADMQQRARAALGPAPATAEIGKALPAHADQLPVQPGGRTEPLASWLRVWHWSPVLPAPLLTDFAPLLAALRRQMPAGPPDPRTVARPSSCHHTAVALDDLLELTATAGPLAAAAALAAAPDASANGYAMVLQRLVGAAPAAWTADVPQVLATLARPELGAFYLAASATVARCPDVFPAGPAEAVLAALTLSRALPAPASPHVPDAAVFAGRAWSDLLSVVWRTGSGLGGDLPAVLDHLRHLAEPLTRPAPQPLADSPNAPAPAPSPAGPDGDGAGGQQDLPEALLDTHPAVRALGCLVEYAASQARTDGEMPSDVLRLAADVLAARPDNEAVAGAVGVQLPVLHRRATAFTATHPELYALTPQRPTPAAEWLRRPGRPDPLLLAALDRGQLLAALRENWPRGIAVHVGHALLAGHHDLLGDPVAACRELTAGPGGAEALSRLFLMLTLLKPERSHTPGGAAPASADRAPVDTAHVWWTGALEAGLPPGALAGAGHFAHLALADDVWLPLARRSAEHTPAQERAAEVAERATRHPQSPDALLLAAHLLTRPAPDLEYDGDMRRHARTLLEAAVALPAADRPAETERLRRALIDAGEIQAARA